MKIPQENLKNGPPAAPGPFFSCVGGGFGTNSLIFEIQIGIFPIH
jgi:hypothetical protein